MSAPLSYINPQCNQFHKGAPGFAFSAPFPYLLQPPEVQAAGELNSDLCFYENDQREHFFIRAMMNVHIRGAAEPFIWSVWVSLSRESFTHYLGTIDHPDSFEPARHYFGWLSSRLPCYEDTCCLTVEVHLQPGGERPALVLHEADHELYLDWAAGITIEKAQSISEYCLHSSS